MVHKVWQEAGLKPHQLERYMTSNDTDFERKGALSRERRASRVDPIEILRQG